MHFWLDFFTRQGFLQCFFKRNCSWYLPRPSQCFPIQNISYLGEPLYFFQNSWYIPTQARWLGETHQRTLQGRHRLCNSHEFVSTNRCFSLIEGYLWTLPQKGGHYFSHPGRLEERLKFCVRLQPQSWAMEKMGSGPPFTKCFQYRSCKAKISVGVSMEKFIFAI